MVSDDEESEETDEVGPMWPGHWLHAVLEGSMDPCTTACVVPAEHGPSH